MKQKYSFLKETLKGTKKLIVLILGITVLHSKLNVYVPMFIQYVLDGVVMGEESVIPVYIRKLFWKDSPACKILILIGVLIVINTLIFILQYGRKRISTKFNLKINRNVKHTILNHIARLEYMQFSSINHADVIQRVNNDAIIYSDFFNSQINLFLDTIFIVGFSALQIFELNQVVGIFVMIICLLIIVLSIWYYKVSKPLVEDTVEANQQMIEKTREAVSNSKMQKAFNRKTVEIEEFRKLNEGYRKKEKRLGKYRTIYGIGTHTIRNFKEPFILLLGGILVVRGEMTLATVSILLTFATKISDYIYDTVNKLKDFNQFLVAYKKLSLLMQTKEEDGEKEEKRLSGDIVFRDVTIKINEMAIIQDINLEIKQGENIAIIGDNGVRKDGFGKNIDWFL